jgi:hypothetical protein
VFTSAKEAPGVKRLGLWMGTPKGAGIDPRRSKDTGTRPSPGTALTDPDLIADNEEGTLANLRVCLLDGIAPIALDSFSTRERGERTGVSGRGMREADLTARFL